MSAKLPIKVCFVTVGATASFEELVRAALDPAFVTALEKNGYSHLMIQYGKNAAIFQNFLKQYPPGRRPWQRIDVNGFSFHEHGLGGEFALAQADISKGRSGGVVISHAGMIIFPGLHLPISDMEACQDLALSSRFYEWASPSSLCPILLSRTTTKRN
jgi:hypothetical protein